ncbi:MAG: hypothetical protein BMS9Abin01_0125 [Gammaproteobacteria bacterium]|nr:MAG: hypothetical protein BMS9Abin01_0125 [Gammaproteobacteria bacterium]
MSLLRQTVLALLILVLLLLAVLVSFMALNIPIDLGLLKKPLANAASSELGMDVRINGDMRLVPGLEPTFEMQGLEITDLENPEDGDTIRLGVARVQLDLLALILGGIRIEELTAEDIRVVAATGRDRGAPPSSAESPQATGPAAPQATTNSNGSALMFEGLANLALRRISVDVRNIESGKQHRFVLDEMTGAATAGQPLRLKARGRYQDQPFRLDMRGESVDKILLLRWSWPLDMRADIAGMSIELTPVEADAATSTSAAIDYRLTISGKRLDELDEIVGVSLPPLGPYSVAGRFGVFDDRYSISDVELGLGESDLKGSFDLDVAGEIPHLKVNLTADVLRLEDFDTGDWSPAGAGADSAPADAGPETIVPLFEPGVLKSFSLQLSLAVKKLESRIRRLGSGSLELRLEDGIITLDPLKVELPRGLAEFAMVLDPGSRSDSRALGLLPVSLSARVADTVLRFDRDDGGAAGKPGRPREIRYRVSVQGKSLDSFDNYAGVSLPPLGPYELTALMTARDTRFTLSDLDIRIGGSDLKGSMLVDISGERPRAAVQLATEVLQLEDFIFEDWTMLDSDEDTEPEQGTTIARGADGVDREQLATLLSRESMARIDAAFTLEVAQVLLGKEELGGGRLGLTLDDGRLEVKPARLDIPGGALNMSFALEPTDEGMYSQIVFDVDRFDYGVLARRQKPDTDMGGHISLDVALDSRADKPENLLRNANGHLLFGIWPDDIEADVFDLWTVNLLLAVLPTVNEGPKSKVNCIVAGLEFRDGVATRKSLLLDTTNMQVGGEIKANFKTEKIDVFLKPQAKVPQFFSLATPVQVNGNFSDFGVSPAPGALVGTVIRMVTSIVTVPVERLFRENIPADGEAACAVAYQGGIPEGR